MARQNPLVGKGIPSFDKFDNKKSIKQRAEETGKDVKPIIEESKRKSDLLDAFQPPQKVQKKQAIFWLELDVIEALDDWANSQEMTKGAKSALVNDLLKKVFNIEQGE